MDNSFRTYTFGPASGGAPKHLVILLHGLGADGRDLLGLAPEFAAALPDAVFVSPDAPFPCDMAPMGRQWFSLQEWTPSSILRGAKVAAPLLESFITEQIKKYNVTAAQTALVGFSQGTMMSLFVGLRYPEKLAGIVGYSGALIDEPGVDLATKTKPPVCLIHGMADMVVPALAYYHARETLEKAGFEVSGHVSPGLPHSIDQHGIDEASVFLQRVLN